MEEFDLINCPLEGTNLIEASAGTGKTYNIAGLFVRLVIEKKLDVKNILVVTYTVAATEELRGRIRAKLKEVYDALIKGQSEDSFSNELVKKYAGTLVRTALTSRLKNALRDFDEASILTIHGFCQRVLHENSFESGTLFDAELQTNEGYMKEEIAYDFWRRHFYSNLPDFVNWALIKKYGPQSFLKSICNEIRNPNILIMPDIPPPSTEAIKERIESFKQDFKKLEEIWSLEKDIIRENLKRSDLSKRSYGDKIDSLVEEMDAFIFTSQNIIVIPDKLKYFTKSKLLASLNKKGSLHEHYFFDAFEKTWDAARIISGDLDSYLLYLRVLFLKSFNDELNRKKAKRNILFYDDLILRLYLALQSSTGRFLAEAVRSKYAAALIDEFQDTDGIQYAIFSSIFKGNGHILFLIGDPKQAIYAFRGADLFAYLKAASQADKAYTLKTNYRSEPKLVSAVNTIFSNCADPFVYKEIKFNPVEKSENENRLYLQINGKQEPPFHWWLIPPPDLYKTNHPISKSQANKIIMEAVAGEVARLIDLGRTGMAKIGDNPLRERDIAILVRTNSQADEMKKVLTSYNVPAVLHLRESVFSSREAIEMERVLYGIASPDEERILRAALATDMIGVCGADLESYSENSHKWEEMSSRFKKYLSIWQERGFIVMFGKLLASEHVRARLVRYPDGERRLTNVLHLSEILQRESAEQRLGVFELISWLSKQINSKTADSEEHQLRLESDEQAVKIVTIHKSKGLEYPIVFCPFVWWRKGRQTPNNVFFHKNTQDRCPVIDLGSSEILENEKLAAMENLAEEVRLFYVALTRAKNRCYFLWGHINDAESSAPAYLFHRELTGEHINPIDAVEERYKKMSYEDIVEEVKRIASKSHGNIHVDFISSRSAKILDSIRKGEDEDLRCRKFSSKIDASWRVSSFSSLVSEKTYIGDLPDYDAVIDLELTNRRNEAWMKGGTTIFDLPGGTEVGIILHKILQRFDFSQNSPEDTRELVFQILDEHGFDTKWTDTITEMLYGLSDVALDFADRIPLTLSQISREKRIDEMEFYFPIKFVSADDIENLLRDFGESHKSFEIPSRIGRLNFEPVRGFMKGYIDMVFQFQNRFYLVDWKSNILGYSREDYNQGALTKVMKESFYNLQALLYTVAVHQYLKHRLSGYDYEKNFGGIFYIFLRGVCPKLGRDYGIYQSRPSKYLIDKASSCLIDNSKDG